MTDDAHEYELVIAQRFVKDMRRLSREDQVRVRRALSRIQLEPYQGRKVVVAETGQYRWRVGSLRIRYDIEGRQIQILRVIKREEAYR
jgi:mRNA-degrading endonuclease RelE of RelBE toxin-antitoxin system